MVKVQLQIIAQAYSCGTYGGTSYGQCVETSSSGSLVDTGYDVLLPVFLGVSLIAASAILIIKRALRRRKLAAE